MLKEFVDIEKFIYPHSLHMLLKCIDGASREPQKYHFCTLLMEIDV